MPKPNIVILDGYTLNPNNDVSWQPIQAHGQVTVYDRSGPLAAERAQDADFVLTNKERIDGPLVDQLPKLRYIGVLATGTNIVDLDAARQRDIPVTNLPGYGAPAVAQHVFALLLELVNDISKHVRAVREGEWQRCPDFSFTLGTMTELDGKTLGIVGVGTIGSRVARIGHSFGMKIAAAYQQSKDQVAIAGVSIEWMSVDELFSTADVITLHCPLTEETEKFVNSDRLARMKPTAILINTGRGGLIDEAALRETLDSGKLTGVGLDVLTEEPPAAGSPLIGAPRCIVTPHIAWATCEARRRMIQIAADNIGAYLRGEATHVVN